MRPIAGLSAWLARHATSVHGRPADLRREPSDEEDVRDERRAVPGTEVAQRAPRERVEAATRRGGGEQHDAEQRDAEPERREDEVFPARLERERAPAEADEQRRGRGRPFDEKPRAAEIADDRHGGEHRPEREEQRVVHARTPGRAYERRLHRREIRGRHEHTCEADDAGYTDEQAGGRVDDEPVADVRMLRRDERDRGERAGRCGRDGGARERDSLHGSSRGESRRERRRRRGGDRGEGERVAANHGDS